MHIGTSDQRGLFSSPPVILQWTMWCRTPSPVWWRHSRGGESGQMGRPAATMLCMWTSPAGARASGRSCTPWSRRKVCCPFFLAPGWVQGTWQKEVDVLSLLLWLMSVMGSCLALSWELEYCGWVAGPQAEVEILLPFYLCAFSPGLGASCVPGEGKLLACCPSISFLLFP